MSAGTNFSSPVFIAMRVRPITNDDASTPRNRPFCCADGVAPTRKPVFRSCDVLPALAAAMQTMPPMVRASAP